MRRHERGRWSAGGFAMALALILAAPFFGQDQPETTPDPDAFQLSSDLRVRVHRGRDIELEVRLTGSDDYQSVAARVAAGTGSAPALAAWNGERRLEPGDWVRVPLALLAPDYRALVLRELFPEDRRDGDAWIHVARSGRISTYDEGLWQVAEWFATDGSAFTELMRINQLSSPELRRRQPVRIPANLLHPALRTNLTSEDGLLEFSSDDGGPYAVYRLRPGEALYSAVVTRFTGRSSASDVGELAELIRQRSGIRDLRDIPVGYPVKIPLDLLEPEFLPPGHPRRQEAEAARAELARELELKPVAGARGLEGVLLILDPGHGGRDLGTMHNGIWEHDYVYDVACRLKQKLEHETAAEVRMTLEDKQTGCTPSKTDKLDANRGGTILTTPPFLAKEEGEAKIGVNLRWYLANSIYRQALKNGRNSDRVLFISLHADSRHPSLRGVMVYVPGAAYRSRNYGHSSKIYRQYKEVREKPYNRFTKKQRVRSEAVSRKLAESIVDSFRRHELPVQPHQPVRGRIIRGKSRYVPAVIKGNAVPTKILVEMLNMSNREDAALLASARHRNRLAEGLLDAVLDYFGEPRP